MLERLQSRRMELGLTLAELGKRVSLTASTLKNYETDRRKPTPETLVRLADALDTSVDYLLGRTDEPSHTGSSPDADPYMAFGASLADGMNYNDLDTVQKAKLIDYYWLLRGQHPKNN